MTKYAFECGVSGEYLGEYDAAGIEEAKATWARAMGCETFEQACAERPCSPDAQLCPSTPEEARAAFASGRYVAGFEEMCRVWGVTPDGSGPRKVFVG